VFSKQAGTKLPHQPWDCAIELLPETNLSKGKIYPLLFPEQQAIGEYTGETIRQDFICPSLSPATSSFFMVQKDGVLYGQLCPQSSDCQVLLSASPGPLPLLNSWGPHACLPSWIFVASTTSSGYRGMKNGRLLSLHHQATVNIRLCRTGCPTHPPYSRDL